MPRACIAAAALALALVGCAPSPRCPVEPLPREAPFLWRVARGDGPPVWLYGTLHNAGAADVPAAAWAALTAAPRYASELGDAELDPDELRALARLLRGKGLDALLPADDWWDLEGELRGRIKPDDLRRARPWYAMSLLTAKLAPGPSPTMDEALTRRARALRHPIDALETWRAQLTTVADAVTITDLQDALRARATMRCDLDAMKQSYVAGVAARMARHLNVDGAGRLLHDRNAAWLPAIERYLAADGAFVAVGLSHLLGDDGLPAQLAAHGYTVARQGW
jgi:uncharacterized protein YbaP (TraB family)